MADKKKKQTGLTWTQVLLIIAIIFGVYQVQQKQQLIKQNQQLEQKMEKCICTWDQAFNTLSKYMNEKD
jgi:uncharacterized membrane-anchored protein YhcB (DUF1043 family)